MNERRRFLGLLSRGTMGLVATVTSIGAIAGAVAKKSARLRRVSPKLFGPGQIPEVVVEGSDQKSLRFYNDLIKGKVVLVNYMSIDNEAALPITAKLLEIAKGLGSKLGTEIHIVSITSDPLHDTPARLRAFVARMGIPAHGWHFVRMTSKQDSMIVSARLHRHPMLPDPHARVAAIHYGNEPVGVWGVFPASISPDDALMRIATILPGQPHAGPARRAGPRKLDAAGMPFNHRVA